MNSIKKSLFICLFFSAFTLHAQNVTVALSNEFNVDNFVAGPKMVTVKAGDYFYTLEMANKGARFGYTAKLDKMKCPVNMHKYDAHMNQVKVAPLDNGQEDFGPFFARLAVINNTVLAFYYKVQDGGTIKLFVSGINTETLAGTPTELYSFAVKNVGIFGMTAVYGNNRLNFCALPGKGKILVTQSGNTNEVFSCLVDTNFNVTAKKTSVFENNAKDITVNAVYADDNENRYISYKYTVDKVLTSGILVQKNTGQEKFVPFAGADGGITVEDLFVKGSAFNNNVYVYGGYKIGDVNEGVVLTTIDAANFTMQKPQQFPYPEDVTKKLYKADFAYKVKGEYSVKPIDYNLIELEDGTVALTGYIRYTMETTFSNSHTLSESIVGPVMIVLFKNGQGKLVLIPRRLAAPPESDCICFGWKNNLVCVYKDGEKNIDNTDPDKAIEENNGSKLVLAAAIISSNGNMVSKRKIADAPFGKGHFAMAYQQRLSSNSVLLPLGGIRGGSMMAFGDGGVVNQWATITVQ